MTWPLNCYEEAILFYDKVTQYNSNFYEGSYNCDMRRYQLIRQSLFILNRGLQLFGPKYTLVSFNGGKDAVVLLHLYLAAFGHYYRQKNISDASHNQYLRPRVIFFRSSNEFSEIEEFVQSTSKTYQIDLRIYNGSYKTALADCLASCYKEESKLHDMHLIEGYVDTLPPVAFVLGLRKGDPSSNHTEICQFSSEWITTDVPFLRLHPLLEWTYGDIWEFILYFKLPYCSLYDKGYTSIGKKNDSIPNPLLRISPHTNDYYPAYHLKDWNNERLGRTYPISSPLPINLFYESGHWKHINKTAGIILIDNDILKGRQTDTFFGMGLSSINQAGLNIERVSFIKNCEDDIIREIQCQMTLFEIIITTGGTGLTYHETTIRAIATALKDRIVKNNQMLEFLTTLYGGNTIDQSYMNIALLPSCAILHYFSNKNRPVIQCANIFLLPEGPDVFQQAMEYLLKCVLIKKMPCSQDIHITTEINTVVPFINQLISYSPKIKIQIYPEATKCEKLCITIHAPSKEELTDALQFFSLQLPEPLRALTSYYEKCCN